MEILKLTCRTLDENVRLFSNHNNCPSDHLSCVSTLIWASKRFDDVPELKEIRHQFRSKFGKKFDEAAVNNLGGICNERVVGKLGSDIQTSILVQVRATRYNTEIAERKSFLTLFLPVLSGKYC
jgi:vacuolar protein sorting-associated protein IST1